MKSLSDYAREYVRDARTAAVMTLDGLSVTDQREVIRLATYVYGINRARVSSAPELNIRDVSSRPLPFSHTERALQVNPKLAVTAPDRELLLKDADRFGATAFHGGNA